MRGHDLFRYVVVGALLFCYATILLGGNVMASDAGLACPDWPSCHGTFAPPLTGGTGIEWSHRLAAFGLSVVILGLTVLAFAFERRRPVLLRLSVGALVTVVVQALLGGLVVESDLVVGVVLLHLALATVLFAVLIVLALVANLKEIPPRWTDWARRASDERPMTADEVARTTAPETGSGRGTPTSTGSSG
ncbi:MAG: COX15/CtaA family protein [Thermoplasmata archaeon]